MGKFMGRETKEISNSCRQGSTTISTHLSSTNKPLCGDEKKVSFVKCCSQREKKKYQINLTSTRTSSLTRKQILLFTFITVVSQKMTLQSTSPTPIENVEASQKVIF